MSQHGDHSDTAMSDSPRPWYARLQTAMKSAWCGNKGIFLILLAQVAGSTMDAIARFLQQGGHGMHSFQVRVFCSTP